MSKNEQTVKAISDMLARLRGEMTEYIKATENKIAALELAHETLTGVKSVASPSASPVKRITNVKTGRRGMRIDRKSGEKTFAFIKERGDKITTVPMVARKFNITPEAASQRMLNLHKAGQIARIQKGGYVDAARIQASQASAQTVEA
jgi:regulator of extracellular matrix RemA (YlzA/DUF370 family)